MVATRLSQRSPSKESSDSSDDSFVDPEPNLCNVCKKTLDDDEEEGDHIKSIECEKCGKWTHNACGNVTPEIFELINQHNFRWFCPPCENKSLNLSHIFVYYQHLQLQHSELIKEVAALKSRLDGREEGDKETPTTDVKTVCMGIFEENIGRITVEKVKECISNNSDKENTSQFPHLLEANAPNNTENIEKFLNTHVKPVINTTISKSDEVSNMLSEMLEEKDQIQKIKLNLVISGIEESGSEQDDIAKVTDIISRELKITPIIEKAERCGRIRPNDDGSPSSPRLLKLKMQNARNRKELLAKAKDFRNSREESIRENVYLRPDQTQKQQLASKNLRDQLRQLRAANPEKSYYIKRGVIQERERVEEH